MSLKFKDQTSLVLNLTIIAQAQVAKVNSVDNFRLCGNYTESMASQCCMHYLSCRVCYRS